MSEAIEIIEYGIVKEIKGKYLTIEIERHESCMHCAAKSACHTMSGGKIHKAKALNLCDGKPGDRVKVTVPSKDIILSATIIYFIPALFLVIGAGLGDHFYKATPFSQNISSGLFGGLFFSLSLLIVLYYSNTRGKKVMPKAVEIVENPEKKSCVV